jgi:hypothetical protein
MSAKKTLENLWNSTQRANQTFEPERMPALPDPAFRYLLHAIEPGAPLANAVRLHMHGEIKLNKWSSFKAEQVIHADRGMIWRATAWMSGIPVRGADRIIGGKGSMIWRLLGIIPVMKASGSDITRSAAGRLQGECVWLPSRLARDDVHWTAQDSLHPRAEFSVAGFTETVDLSMAEEGRLLNVSLPRWGIPKGPLSAYMNSALSLRKNAPSGLTRSLPGCALVGTLDLTVLRNKVSSFVAPSIGQNFDEWL